jgi:hypothetical protein
MRRRLTNAITVGLGLAGCGTRALPGGSEGGTEAGDATTMMSADDDEGDMSITGVPTTASASTTMSADDEGEAEAVTDPSADDDEGDDDTPIFDIGGDVTPDVGSNGLGCDLDAEPPLTPGIECEVVEYMDRTWVMICVPMPADGCETSDSIAVGDALSHCFDPNDEYSCSGLYDSCGPIEDGDASCCYWGTTGQTCPGRPFTIDGEARLAPITARGDWSDAWPRAAERDELLAQAWLFDARHEHAAIASFARFAMELLAIAAPARFVEAAVRAASDEREHATLFFGLAQAHGHAAIGPGPLDTRGALDRSNDLEAIVVATVREGCIAETISAMQLAAARDGAKDPALRDALARVHTQELEHVELAWTFVAWAYARGDSSLRAAVEQAFAEAWAHTPKGPDVDARPEDAAAWRAAGRITHGDRDAIAMTTLRTLVEPAAREMFARSVEAPSALIAP